MASKFDPRKTCLHLRSKEMYYEIEDPEAEKQQKTVEKLYGTCEERLHWCDCTQTGRGPDDRPVSAEECRRAGRRCFVSIHSLT